MYLPRQSLWLTRRDPSYTTAAVVPFLFGPTSSSTYPLGRFPLLGVLRFSPLVIFTFDLDVPDDQQYIFPTPFEHGPRNDVMSS